MTSGGVTNELIITKTPYETKPANMDSFSSAHHEFERALVGHLVVGIDMPLSHFTYLLMLSNLICSGHGGILSELAKVRNWTVIPATWIESRSASHLTRSRISGSVGQTSSLTCLGPRNSRPSTSRESWSSHLSLAAFSCAGGSSSAS